MLYGRKNILCNYSTFPCLLIILALSFGGQGMVKASSPPPVQAEISIIVEDQAKVEEGPSEDRLIRAGRHIIEKTFQKDVGKSRSAKGTIRFLERNGTSFRYEMVCLFLYRETYTAVTHTVIFRMPKERYTIISVDNKPWIGPGH